MASVHPPPFRNPICALLNKDRMNLIEKLHIWPRIPLACGIRYPKDWNLEYSSMKPETHQRLESGIQYLESGNHRVKTRIQHCLGFPYMGQMTIWKYNLKTYVRPSMCYWSDSPSLSFQWCRWSPLEYWTRALLNFLYTRSLEIRSTHVSLPWGRMKDSPQISARELAAIQSSRKKKKKRNWSRASSILSPLA